MKTQSLWKSGLLAGLVMVIVPLGIMFISNPMGDAAELAGYLFICSFPIWISACAVFGVWIYRRMGNAVSIKDGVRIGGISSILWILLILGFAIFMGITYWSYNSDNIIREGLIGIGFVLAFVVFLLLTTGFGGFLGATIFQNKTSELISTPENLKVENGSAHDDIASSVTKSQQVTIEPSNKSPIAAVLLSFFLFGGGGQIYLGQRKKGLAIILAFFIGFIFPFLSFGALAIGIGDAYGIALRLKNGNSIGEWEFIINWKVAILGILIWIVVFVFLYISSFWLINLE